MEKDEKSYGKYMEIMGFNYGFIGFTRPGTHTKKHGKTRCLMGKSTMYKWPCSIANC